MFTTGNLYVLVLFSVLYTILAAFAKEKIVDRHKFVIAVLILFIDWVSAIIFEFILKMFNLPSMIMTVPGSHYGFMILSAIFQILPVVSIFYMIHAFINTAENKKEKE